MFSSASRPRFNGCNELLFAAFLLAAVLLTAYLPSAARKGAAPLFVRYNSTNTDDCTSTNISSGYLEFLETRYSMEHVWHYCWMNSAYFLKNPKSATPGNTKVSGVQKSVNVGSLVVWTVQTFDAQGAPLRHGGEMLQLVVEGPALLRPRVFDLRNGTYVVKFVVYDAGRYKAKMTLRWPSCKAYVFCSVEDRFQPVDEVAVAEFTAIEEEQQKQIVTVESISSRQHYAAGRWILSNAKHNSSLYPLLRGGYVWQPYSSALKLLNFPAEKLRGRWIYFIGDSISEHAFNQLVREILPQSACSPKSIRHVLVNRFNGNIMKDQYKRDAMQLYYCGDLNLTMAFTFFPDSLPVGGFKYTRFPLINETTNSVEAAHNVTFVLRQWRDMLHKAMNRYPEIPSFSNPDAVVFNFGLHYAASLDPPLYAVLLRHMLMTLQSEFPSESTKLFWRSTAYTHFENNKLASKWNCRTPVRTEIMNEVASKIVEAVGLETLDFQMLTAARADATPDNRHFSLGNVRATFNNILLNRLNELWNTTNVQ